MLQILCYRGNASTKKVINSIIDYYGKPDEIHVEMARDLKLPKAKARNVISK